MKIYIQTDDANRLLCYGTTRSNDSDIEVEVNETDDVLKNPFIYTCVNGQLIRNDQYLLEIEKSNKLEELNQACNDTILGVFQVAVNGSTYSFSHDLAAQQNFSNAKLAFMDNLLTTISWTAYDNDNNVVRLTLDKDAFNTVYLAHLNHVSSNISKFRDTLQSQVESAINKAQLDNIVW